MTIKSFTYITKIKATTKFVWGTKKNMSKGGVNLSEPQIKGRGCFESRLTNARGSRKTPNKKATNKQTSEGNRSNFDETLKTFRVEKKGLTSKPIISTQTNIRTLRRRGDEGGWRGGGSKIRFWETQELICRTSLKNLSPPPMYETLTLHN